MIPSARAMELYNDIEPILRGMQRILSPKIPFDPLTSTRIFRIGMPDFSIEIFKYLATTLQSLAPNITIEWVTPNPSWALEVAEGQMDLALVPTAIKVPEGIGEIDIGHMHWKCYLRAEHPALKKWDRHAWQKYPHIAVRIGDKLRSPVEHSSLDAKLQRRIGIWVPHFSAVAPILADSNLIATLPHLCISDALPLYPITAVNPPFSISPMPHKIIFGTKQAGDPGTQWLKNYTIETISAFFDHT